MAGPDGWPLDKRRYLGIVVNNATEKCFPAHRNFLIHLGFADTHLDAHLKDAVPSALRHETLSPI